MARFSWKRLFKLETSDIVLEPVFQSKDFKPLVPEVENTIAVVEQQKLNGEFALLEVKLGELRTALVQLREAMSQLERLEQKNQEDHALMVFQDNERLN